jgi:hypothetical protein
MSVLGKRLEAWATFFFHIAPRKNV